MNWERLRKIEAQPWFMETSVSFTSHVWCIIVILYYFHILIYFLISQEKKQWSYPECISYIETKLYFSIWKWKRIKHIAFLSTWMHLTGTFISQWCTEKITRALLAKQYNMKGNHKIRAIHSLHFSSTPNFETFAKWYTKAKHIAQQNKERNPGILTTM